MGMDVLCPFLSMSASTVTSSLSILNGRSSPLAACPSCGADHVQRLVSLCSVSSESSRAANLSAAHQRAATRRQDKQRSEHAEHHDHFSDAAHK